MTRLLVLMGSGETTPTMVTPHQRILAAVGDGARVVLDTPYGFQENADDLSARTVEYFAHNIGQHVDVVSLRDATTAGAVAIEVVAARVAEAAWLFAGPGSPSYLARQWLATSLPDVLRARLLDATRPSATVFASAAACTVGRLAIPVYELYKVGEAPHWREGLDLLRPLGLDAIVVPHYDNAEGGTHDTSCCYVGERRLRILETELDPSTWVLGVDEHTAAIIDLDARALRVEGRGRVVLRVRGAEHVLDPGTTIALGELLDTVAQLGAVRPIDAHVTGDARPVAGGGADDAFAAAVGRGDLIGAADATVGLLGAAGGLHDDVRAAVVRQVAALARIAQAGMHEHRGLIAPHVETLLDLRRQARVERRYADADTIRDALLAAGIEVRDGSDATGWEFTDPLAGSLASALEMTGSRPEGASEYPEG
jgi:hypothetical protein